MRWHVCFREPVASILHLFNSTGPRCTWISRHYVRACLRERERVRGKRHKLKKKKDHDRQKLGRNNFKVFNCVCGNKAVIEKTHLLGSIS